MPTPTMDPVGLETQVVIDGGAAEPFRPREHHVFQRLKRLRHLFELTDPYWAEIVTMPEVIAVADYYGFEVEVARTLRVGDITYAKAIRDGMLARLSATLEDYDPVDVEGTPGNARRNFSTTNPIVVGELHCPWVDGAKATFASTSTRARKIGIEIKAKGLGGGGGTRERVFASSSTMTVEAPQCAVLLTSLSGHYEIWKRVGTEDDLLLLTNVTGATSLEADDLDKYPDYAESHLCDKPWAFDHLEKEIKHGTLVAGADYDSFGTPVTEESLKEAEWTKSYEYSGRWGFETELAGKKLGGAVTYTSTFTSTIKIGVSCPKGYRYISRFRASEELPQQWAAKGIGR